MENIQFFYSSVLPLIDRAAKKANDLPPAWPEPLPLALRDHIDDLCRCAGEHAFAASLQLGLALSRELEPYALPEDYFGRLPPARRVDGEKL